MNTRPLPLGAFALFALLAGCTCGAPSPTEKGAVPSWTGAKLDSTGDASLVLDRMEATYALSPRNTASTAERTSTSVLTEFTTGEAHGLLWHRAPLPFRVPISMRRFKPKGVVVTVDGKVATFAATRLRATGQVRWRIDNDDLLVHDPDGDVSEVRVERPQAEDRSGRLGWEAAQASGMSESEYTRYGLTFGRVSREGLLLPAPSAATYPSVTLPQNARFDTWLALVPSLATGKSDGADVVLAWVTDGEEVELGRTRIEAGSPNFHRWTLDLSAHAGATGDLILRTEPGTTSVGDYVFLGSPAVQGTPDGEVRRVIVIGIDTLRPDHLGLYGYPKPTSPELDAWAERAMVFDKAWTSAPRTRPSFRAATTGRLPLDAVCAKNIGEVFDEHRFATAGITANVHLNPRFDFQKGFDYWQVDGSHKVTDQIELAQTWLDENRDRDSYLFLHIMDPHLFYVAPESYRQAFRSELPPLPANDKLARMYNRKTVYRWMKRGKLSDLKKQHIEAEYDAEIAYTSFELDTFLNFVDALPGRTTVLIHSDHGEELWEHDGYEHNHTLYNETTKAVMILRPPGGTDIAGSRSDAMATLQDIGPTLYDMAGLTDTPPTDGVSLLPALRGTPADPDRPIPIGYLKYGTDRWGLVWKGHKYSLWTGTGQEELFDLDADPIETNNLIGTMDATPWWVQLGKSHHVDIGHGWRLNVTLTAGQALSVTLPADALSAGVIDPEYVVKSPVNQAWGYEPPIKPHDVAEVTLADPRTVQIVGGDHGRGVLYIRFADPVDPHGATMTVDEKTVPFQDGSARAKGAKIVVTPGVVVVPPPDEAIRMAKCGLEFAGENEAQDAEDIARLCALGYKSGPECEPFQP